MAEISAQYSYNAFHPQKDFTISSPQNTPTRLLVFFHWVNTCIVMSVEWRTLQHLRKDVECNWTLLCVRILWHSILSPSCFPGKGIWPHKVLWRKRKSYFLVLWLLYSVSEGEAEVDVDIRSGAHLASGGTRIEDLPPSLLLLRVQQTCTLVTSTEEVCVDVPELQKCTPDLQELLLICSMFTHCVA